MWLETTELHVFGFFCRRADRFSKRADHFSFSME